MISKRVHIWMQASKMLAEPTNLHGAHSSQNELEYSGGVIFVAAIGVSNGDGRGASSNVRVAAFPFPLPSPLLLLLPPLKPIERELMVPMRRTATSTQRSLVTRWHSTSETGSRSGVGMELYRIQQRREHMCFRLRPSHFQNVLHAVSTQPPMSPTGQGHILVGVSKLHVHEFGAFAANGYTDVVAFLALRITTHTIRTITAMGGGRTGGTVRVAS